MRLLFETGAGAGALIRLLAGSSFVRSSWVGKKVSVLAYSRLSVILTPP